MFLVPKLKLAFSLRSVSEDSLHNDFDSLERFFDKYGKLREDVEYVEDISEDAKNFSAKAIAKMFNVIDSLGSLPETSNDILLLYFLHKRGFEIDCHQEDKVDLDKLKKKGWQVLE